MELRLPYDTVLLIAERWVNQTLASPLKVKGVKLDCGCHGAHADLVLEIERGDRPAPTWQGATQGREPQSMQHDDTESAACSHVRLQYGEDRDP